MWHAVAVVRWEDIAFAVAFEKCNCVSNCTQLQLRLQLRPSLARSLKLRALYSLIRILVFQSRTPPFPADRDLIRKGPHPQKLSQSCNWVVQIMKDLPGSRLTNPRSIKRNSFIVSILCDTSWETLVLGLQRSCVCVWEGVDSATYVLRMTVGALKLEKLRWHFFTGSVQVYCFSTLAQPVATLEPKYRTNFLRVAKSCNGE